MSTPTTAPAAPAALTATAYKLTYRHLGRGRIGDLLAADLRLGLTGAGYSPADTDEWWSTPAAYEATGTGYPPGGIALPNTTFDLDAGTGRAVLGCDPLLMSAAGFTARYGVLFVNTGAPAASPLLSYVDFGATVSPAGNDLRLSFSAGVFRIGAAGA